MGGQEWANFNLKSWVIEASNDRYSLNCRDDERDLKGKTRILPQDAPCSKPGFHPGKRDRIILTVALSSLELLGTVSRNKLKLYSKVSRSAIVSLLWHCFISFDNIIQKHDIRFPHEENQLTGSTRHASCVLCLEARYAYCQINSKLTFHLPSLR